MSAGLRSPVIILGLLAFMGLQHYGVPACAAEAELEVKERELQQVKQGILDARSQLDAAQNERRQVMEDLRTQETAIGQRIRQLREIESALQAQTRRLAELEEKRGVEEQRLDGDRQALASQMRAAYASGRQEWIKLLLSQQDPAIVSRIMVYYDYLNRDRVQRIALVKQRIAHIRDLASEISERERGLRELQHRQAAERDRLELQQTQREQLLAALESQIRDRGDELAELQRDAERLEQLLNELQVKPDEVELEQQPFSARKGHLAWPAKGRLGVSFGSRRKGSNLRWDGVVLNAKEDAEVRAVHHGRVAFADWLRGFGLLLIIDHGGGYMTLYGHNKSLFKETGDWVDAGESVALVGRSGGRARPSVYFAIRYQGKPLNPTAWCVPLKRNRVGDIFADLQDKKV